MRRSSSSCDEESLMRVAKPVILGESSRRYLERNARGNPVSVNVAIDMAEAMKTNPRLKVMVNGGYYDLATPFFAAQYE
jgi:carboxypeptidase C (cathepsin A)